MKMQYLICAFFLMANATNYAMEDQAMNDQSDPASFFEKAQKLILQKRNRKLRSGGILSFNSSLNNPDDNQEQPPDSDNEEPSIEKASISDYKANNKSE